MRTYLPFFALALTACSSTATVSNKLKFADSTGLTVIKDVKVFDGNKLLPATNVFITANIVAALDAKKDIPEDAEVIDGKGKTLLPGFIDSNTDVQDARDLINALFAGVTTEIDLESPVEFVKSIKILTDRDHIICADVLAAGIPANKTNISDPREGLIFTDALLTDGADQIKIIYDGPNAVSKPVLQSLIQASRYRLVNSFVDAETWEKTRDAVEFGANAITHIPGDGLIDPQMQAMLRANKTVFISTLGQAAQLAGEGVGPLLIKEKDLGKLISPSEAKKLLKKSQTKVNANFKFNTVKSVAAQLSMMGIPVVAGTDAGTPGIIHGVSLHAELKMLVDAGFSPIAALGAVTSVPAKYFKLDGKGIIARGSKADLILVEGDPTVNIKDTRRIVEVWKRGNRIDRSEYLAEISKLQGKEETMRKAGPPFPSVAGKPAMIANFESGKLDSFFGTGWKILTDQTIDGASTAEPEIVKGGAQGSRFALRIKADVTSEGKRNFSGLVFFPGPGELQPANLTTKPKLVFWAKAPFHQEFAVLIFDSSPDYQAVHHTFSGTGEWTRYEVDLSKLEGMPAYSIAGILFGNDRVNSKNDFMIDNIALE